MMTDNVDWHIRDGTESDCEVILQLINGFSINEGLSDHVKVTADDLRRDSFYTYPPLVHTVVAESTSAGSLRDGIGPDSENRTNTIIGYALFNKTYSTWNGKGIHLEHLYVRPEYRLKGVGHKILKYIAKVAYTEGDARISWECNNWNEPVLKFCKKYGAEDVTIKDHWHSYTFVEETLKQLVYNEQ